MSKHISIQGLNKAEVVTVLFLNSQRYTFEPPHTEVILRAMDFNGDTLDPTPYDDAHYEGYAEQVLEHYRQTGGVRRYEFAQ